MISRIHPTDKSTYQPLFVATYIMKAKLLPIRINIRGNEKLKKIMNVQVRFF